MSTPNAVTDSDDIFSDDSQATKVASASDQNDTDQDVKSALNAPRDAPEDERDYAGQVFWWLVAFRILNASLIRTVFQADEYFQVLEPAWDIAFGPNSGAWITWEWKHHMRSTIPPFMFGGLYWISAKLAEFLQLSPSWRAELLIAAPKTLQACISAIGDYYTWKLGELAYGEGELAHWFTLILTVANPFHFFVTTRTFANCTELTINAAALYLWFTSAPEDPTSALLDQSEDSPKDQGSKPLDQSSRPSDQAEDRSAAEPEDGNLSNSWISTKLEESTIKVKEFVVKQVRAYDLNRLRFCLVLAAIGCILRVTNIFTWLALVSFEFFDYQTTWYHLFTIRRWDFRFSVPRVWPQLRELNHAHSVLVRESFLCGTAVLGLSMVLDKHYYGEWSLPAFQFLRVNVAENISAFYGTRDPFYYYTQGLPLLLGLFTPFAFAQIRYHLFTAIQVEEDFQSIMKYEFSAIVSHIPLIFSLIGHKETRFVYPLTPMLSTLAAGPAAEWFRPLFVPNLLSRLNRKTTIRLGIAGGIVFINLLAAILMCLFHQRAPIDVLDYLRHEYEAHYLTQPPVSTGLPQADTSMTVGFLMPCHSTPWRSHLVHPGIKAWALGCEPPLGYTSDQKALYRDEADQFYDDPKEFLKRTLGKPKRSEKHAWSWGGTHEGFGAHGKEDLAAFDGKPGRKIWPEYLVFFAEKEALLAKVLDGTDYVQCWRGWNSWWHDDWRRRGDVVVWCLADKTFDFGELGGVMAQKLTKGLKKGMQDSGKEL